MEKIHQAALTILEEVGLKVESEKAHNYLRKAGCLTDESSWIVRFPRKILDFYVDKMRQDYAIPGRVPEKMAVRYSHVRFRKEPHRIHRDFSVSSGGFCCYIHDPYGNRRPADLGDVHRAIHLVNNLEEIQYSGLPVSDQQTPGHLRPVKMAGELAKYTTKFGGVETFRKEDIPYLIDIGCVVKGDLNNLRAEPVLVGYAEARSPLVIDRNMAEIFIEYIERGFPQTLDTMPCAGATAPATAAGTLAVGMAETLGAMVLAYAVDVEAVVGVDIIPSYFDMHSGVFRYASADRMTLLMARVQLISEFYGCPSGVHGGKTDSCFVNIQTGVEKAMSTVLPVLAGAVGIGTVGHLENAVTFSPQQLVIDNEIIRYVRRSLRPIEINEETLALDSIRRVGTGGHYLEEPHTLTHFRDELFLSSLFEVMPWETSHRQETQGMEMKALNTARDLWEQNPEPVIDTEKIRAIDSIIERAEELLTGD